MARVSSQYQNHLNFSSTGDSHYIDKTGMRLSYLYDGNPSTRKTASWYWDGADNESIPTISNWSSVIVVLTSSLGMFHNPHRKGYLCKFIYQGLSLVITMPANVLPLCSARPCSVSYVNHSIFLWLSMILNVWSFSSKVNIWNVNCARATALIFNSQTDVLVKVLKI